LRVRLEAIRGHLETVCNSLTQFFHEAMSIFLVRWCRNDGPPFP